MRAARAFALVALALVAAAPSSAKADVPLVIVVSGTGALPVDKIADHIRAALPELQFTIRTTPELRSYVARGRLVRWEDGRVAVGFRDSFAREDVHIVRPGADQAFEIARAFVALRERLLAEPFDEVAARREWMGSGGVRDLDSNHPDSSDRPEIEEEIHTHRTARLGWVAATFGIANQTWAADSLSTFRYHPHASIGLDLAFFPARLLRIDGPSAFLGGAGSLRLSSDGLDYSNQTLDVAAIAEVPLARTERWVRLRAGWRMFSQNHHDSNALDGFTVRYRGPQGGIDASTGVTDELSVSAGLLLHFATVQGVLADPHEPSTLGWMARVGCANHAGGAIAWTIDVELQHYGPLLEEGPVDDTSVRMVVGVGYDGR